MNFKEYKQGKDFDVTTIIHGEHGLPILRGSLGLGFFTKNFTDVLDEDPTIL
jgi:hypothetical protein